MTLDLRARMARLSPAAQPRPQYVAATMALVRSRDAHRNAVALHRSGALTDDQLDAAHMRLGLAVGEFAAEADLHHTSRCEAPHEGERCGRCHGCETHTTFMRWTEPQAVRSEADVMRRGLLFAADGYTWRKR